MSNHEILQIIKGFIGNHYETINIFKQLTVHKGIINFNGEPYTVLGIITDSNYNNIATKALKEYAADIIMLIDIKNNIALFQKEAKCPVDLNKLVRKLSTGGGTADIAGCLLNENIIKLTKLLSPC